MAGLLTTTGNYNARGAENVDKRLFEILRRAAERSGRRVELFSGYRPGSKGKHGSGKATDVRLFDAQGKPLANYQDPSTFRDYERFAQDARRAQQELYPDLNNAFRWGGYFWNGGPGNYGNMDLMHMDIGGGNGLGMAAGGWDTGLNARARKAYPGAESVGLSASTQQPYAQPTTGPAAGFVPAEADKPEYATPGTGAAGPTTPGGGVGGAVPNPGAIPAPASGKFEFNMPDLASYYRNQGQAAPMQGIIASPQVAPLDPSGNARQTKMIEQLLSQLKGAA